MSKSGVMIPSMFPNMDDSPRVNSVTKKSTAHTGAPGMCRMASVKTMKARPVPEALCNTHGAHAGAHAARILHCEAWAGAPTPLLGPEPRGWSCSVWAAPAQLS